MKYTVNMGIHFPWCMNNMINDDDLVVGGLLESQSPFSFCTAYPWTSLRTPRRRTALSCSATSGRSVAIWPCNPCVHHAQVWPERRTEIKVIPLNKVEVIRMDDLFVFSFVRFYVLYLHISLISTLTSSLTCFSSFDRMSEGTRKDTKWS